MWRDGSYPSNDLAVRETVAPSEQPSDTILNTEYVGRVVLDGRIGIGHQVKINAVGDWLDVRFIDSDGVLRGFSLNSYYTGQLIKGLVAELVDRAEPGSSATGTA